MKLSVIRFVAIGLLISFWPFAEGFCQTSKAPTGRVLLLSDIHFDPLADPAIVRELIQSDVGKWQAIFASSKKAGYPHTGEDANYLLFHSTLTAVREQAPFDFVVGLGDYLRHNFQKAFVQAGGAPDDFSAFATKTARFVINSIQTATEAPVYFALGNDDSTCGDYRVDPGGPFLSALADSLTVLALRPEAAASFRIGGFYQLPHPTLPHEEVIVLNSVLWSHSYSNCGSDPGDPGEAEMKWLAWQLYEAKISGHKVMLVMHIPPGIDAYGSSQPGNHNAVTSFWQERFLNEFLGLMQGYGNIVQIGLAGHTHMDDFRVLGASGNRSAVGIRITPGISPIFGNNPAFSVLSYDPAGGEISDIATNYLDLKQAASDPKWALEYRFSAEYGYHAVTAENLANLAGRLRTDPKVRQIFEGYYAASGSSSMTSSNWRFYSCAQNELVPAQYARCVK